MIKIFAYQNKQGTKSIKIVGVVGENATMFGGISLGKVLYNSDFTLDEVVDALKDYDVLDHMPRRGEGLTQFNPAYKMFNKSSVYCTIGELDPAKVDSNDLEKAIRVLKNLGPAEESKIVETIPEGEKQAGEDSIGLFPDEVIVLLANSGTSGLASAAKRTLSNSNIGGADEGVSHGSGIHGIGAGAGHVSESEAKAAVRTLMTYFGL